MKLQNTAPRLFITFLVCIGLTVLSFFIYTKYFYDYEMNCIKEDLNKIKNVTVLKIWGHKDVTLEEVAARLLIKDKGEIVLQGLSDDSFEYPDHVWISEINGLTFTSFSCDGNLGIDSRINIGKKSPLGKLIGIEFTSANDVIHHYDTITRFVNSLKKVPEANYLSTQTREEYLFIENKKLHDQDPIYDLIGIEDKADFAKKLKWRNPECAQ